VWRPRLFRALRGLDGFGGVRSRGTPRMTLARFARDFGEHERRFPGCLGGALARSTTLRSCPRLALRFALSGGRCLGSAACLASLHPRPPRGSRSPAMTLMRFVSHRFGADRPSPHPGTDRTVVPSELERDLAQIDLAGPLGPAAHATAFQSFPPRPDWVSVSRSLPSCGSHWTASIRRPRARFRASFPGIRRASRSWSSSPVAFLGFPFKVFAFTALAHGLIPGHPPARFLPRARRLSKPVALECCAR
jgi:hypothetical protein